MKVVLFVMMCLAGSCVSKPSKGDIVLAKMRAENDAASKAEAAQMKKIRLYFENESKKRSDERDAYYAAGRLELFKKMGVDPNAPLRGGGSGFISTTPRRSLTEELGADRAVMMQQRQIDATREVAREIESAARNASFDAAVYR
jgi:hypothetical protein